MAYRMQHCFWCGDELGEYDNYGETEACGKKECQRELRYELQAEDAERRDRAKQDGFERYR